MVKTVLLPILAVIVFIVVIGLYTQNKLNLSFLKKPQPTQTIQNNQKTVKIGGTSVFVEIANTAALRQQGLSFRSALGENDGMLFVFDTKPTVTRFWMKDMMFPLDIIWIKEGVISQIDKNAPVPQAGTPNNQLPIYGHGTPVDYVLEVNAGFTDKNNIKEGDLVDFSNI